MSSSACASRARRRTGRTWAVLALALALAVAGGQALAAQETVVVGRIVVRVDGQPGEAGLLDLIPIKPGDVFSPRLVDQAVKQIFRTGLFADVRVTKEGEQRIDLCLRSGPEGLHQRRPLQRREGLRDAACEKA